MEDLESALHFNLPAAPPGARHPRATGGTKVEGLAEDPVGPRGERSGPVQAALGDGMVLGSRQGVEITTAEGM